jgi:hypothetical protein
MLEIGVKHAPRQIGSGIKPSSPRLTPAPGQFGDGLAFRIRPVDDEVHPEHEAVLIAFGREGPQSRDGLVRADLRKRARRKQSSLSGKRPGEKKMGETKLSRVLNLDFQTLSPVIKARI